MAAYDPRTDTGIPTEPVGSLPRSSALQEAYAKYDAGEIAKDDLEKLQDAAVKESIERFEATGSPIISDGEQRLVQLRHLPDHGHAGRHRAGSGPRPGGQFFAIFADGHGRQLPKLVSGPFRYNLYAADLLRKSIRYASKPMKQAVIAPSMLALLYPLKDPVEGYSREEFEASLIDECEKDIREAFAAGAARVSVDFTEGRLATREDPRNPWTGAGLLPHFIELINRVMARFSAQERTQHRRAHLPRWRPGLGALGGRALQQPAEHHVRHQRRLLPDPAGLRTGQGPGLRVHRQAPAHRRGRGAADGVHRLHGDPVAAGGVAAGDRQQPDPGGQLHRQGAARARPTTAASRRSRSTRSPTTGRRTTPATSPSARSSRGSRAPGWRRRSSVSDSDDVREPRSGRPDCLLGGVRELRPRDA